MSDPYRSVDFFPSTPKQPSFSTRWWRRWIGQLVYGGEKTCGHCKYWKPRKYWQYGDVLRSIDERGKGDCKLLYGKEDTKKDDTCERFKPRRRYMHREKC